jgi:hypothetical protein
MRRGRSAILEVQPTYGLASLRSMRESDRFSSEYLHSNRLTTYKADLITTLNLKFQILF